MHDSIGSLDCTEPQRYAMMANMDTSDLPRSQSALLPEDFTFSQTSLQAFEDCPRRFWLAYVEQLPWPAVEAAPVQQHEELMRAGAYFHRLVERAEIGIDPQILAERLTPPIDQWFAAYRQYRPNDLPSAFCEVEQVLSMPFRVEKPGPDAIRIRVHDHPAPGQAMEDQVYRLAAKFDLVTAEPEGPVVIVDLEDHPTADRSRNSASKASNICVSLCIGECKLGISLGSRSPGAS